MGTAVPLDCGSSTYACVNHVQCNLSRDIVNIVTRGAALKKLAMPRRVFLLLFLGRLHRIPSVMQFIPQRRGRGRRRLRKPHQGSRMEWAKLEYHRMAWKKCPARRASTLISSFPTFAASINKIIFKIPQMLNNET